MTDNLNSAAEQCSGDTGTTGNESAIADRSAGADDAIAAPEDNGRDVGGGRAWQYAYYGDDFTGSTDVLEALYRSGLRPVLFLDAPTEERLGDPRFAAADACGVAGVGRSLSPEEMARELPPVLETLRGLGPAIVHYKICSTFDSAPHVGSIGKAAELGAALFGGRYVPILAGVPYLGRYTVFGQHFAVAGEAVYRLDRHPTMSRHPVTPMAESDLRRHLAQQTEMTSALMDILALDGEAAEASDRLEVLLEQETPELVLFDVLDERRLRTAGQLMLTEAERSGPLYVIGSSGVAYAVGAELAERRADGEARAELMAVAPVDRLLAVSGSCSPVTERQLAAALSSGFAGIRVPAESLLRPELAQATRSALLAEAGNALAAGRSVVLYTATGPADPAIAALRQTLAELGFRSEDSSRLLGEALGALTRQLVVEAGLTRVLIAGGDTSGYVTRGLGIYALECAAALAPGAPLCRASADDPVLDGLELVLKGGQVGGEHFFEQVRQGT